MPELEYDRRRLRRDALAEEARRIAEDPADRAEMRTVSNDMDAVAAEWPADEAESPRDA